jgi:hypothetical protein
MICLLVEVLVVDCWDLSKTVPIATMRGLWTETFICAGSDSYLAL